VNSRILILLSLTAFMAACATSSEKPRAKARIDVQEQVGFTITEPVTVSDHVRVDYEQALSYLRQGEPERGTALLNDVVVAAPHVSGPRIDLGIAYHASGDLEAAETHLRQALELNPDHPMVHNELGIIYRKTGRFAEARRSYEAALAIYPGYHYARRNLGVLCDLYLADLDCALASYEAYMTTVPGDAQATMWITDLRNRMSQEN
jgi:Flp pilus assembly protein TadD